MTLPPLSQAVPYPVRTQVVDMLRDAIINAFFEPGGRLTERSLCEWFGVSRSTVRESLRQLEAEGLVRITPNRGPMVADLSWTEAEEIYDIRAKLQALASEDCARAANPKLVSGLGRALTDMRKASKKGDFLGLQTARTAFYNLLFEGGGNQQLAALLKQLRARMTLMRGLDDLRPERMEEAVRGAGEILAAVRAGDPEAAGAAAQAHIARARALVFEALRRSAAKQALKSEEGVPN